VNLCFQQDLIRKLERRIKTSKRIKLNHDENFSEKIPEDSRKQPSEAEPERPLGGTGWPHLGAVRPLVVGLACQLLEYSSTAFLDCIYAVP
jgi:hypothetical protein